MRVGLVLEGGAKRGIYTAGVLDVMLEHGLLVDGVFGVSAGAIHGCSYASMQAGRSIRYNMKYGNDYRFMSFKSLFLSGNMVDTQFCYHDLPEKLDPYDNDAFMKSGIEFYAVCSNVESGKPEYIKCKDMFADIDYIRASASMPLVSQIVEVGGKKLLDGGIADSIPLKAAENHGFEKNIVVFTRPKEYRKKKASLRWLIAWIYRKYPNFVKAFIERPEMYNAELDYIEKQEKAGKILVIRPSKLIKIKKMEPNLRIVREMYDLGRSDALKMIDKIEKYMK